jgi:hypothetical protein
LELTLKPFTKNLFFSFLFFYLIGCSSSPDEKNLFITQIIYGRNSKENSERLPIYRLKVPREWIQNDVDKHEILSDTTKNLAEFHVFDGGKKIRITIHNFPSDSQEDRISPSTQIARWKRQFEELCPETVQILPQAFGGFSGFFFEGSGVLNKEPTTVIGWSMSLANEHYNSLTCLLGKISCPSKTSSLKQMKADYTIKVTGPQELMEKHKKSIVKAGRSFELIDELPSYL